MQFIYRFLNIAGIWIGVLLLSIVLPEYNSVDAPSDKDEVLSYGLFSLVVGIFFYYKFYTRRKKGREEQRKLEQELKSEKKRKAELAKKKKLEAEEKRKAEEENKKKREAEKKKQLLAEQKKKEALALEKKKKAEQIHIEKNSYFYEVEKNNMKSIRGPFTKQEMDDLLEKNEITLTTKIKFGLHIKTLKELRTFPEFTLGLEDFL